MIDRSDYSNLEHEIVLYNRVPSSELIMDPLEFIKTSPIAVKSKIFSLLRLIAKAPPKRFSGGGYWEAMRGSMRGWYELRIGGPGRMHYRLFCILDYEALNFNRHLLVVIAGMKKKNGEVFSTFDYARVRNYGDEYLSKNPRQIGFLRLSQAFVAWPLVRALISVGSQVRVQCQRWLLRWGLIS